MFKINNLRNKVERYTGFYTKKGCIETSTNIGKKLVDIQKSGKCLTVQDILDAIKEIAPHIKIPNIVTNKDEFLSLIEKNKNLNELDRIYAVKTIVENDNLAGVFSHFLKGIYVKFDKFQSEKPHTIAHELEHFIEFYCNPQTIIKRLFLLPEYIKLYFNNIKIKQELEFTIDKEGYIRSRLSKILQKPFDPQSNLINFFAANTRKYAHFSSKIIEGYEPTTEGLKEFLKSPIYYGLTSDKRIDAYIRAILRHDFHPLKTKPKKLRKLKNLYKREANAYETTDNITRYNLGKEGITAGKIRSEIFKRAAKILDNEIKIAYSKGNKKLVHQTGLPTTAVVPKEIT